MNMLIAGLAIFVLIHLVPCAPAMRSGIIGKIGDSPYKALFSVLSAVSLVLIVLGLKGAETVTLYDPPSWGRPVNFILMFIAIYLVLSNPLGSAPSSAKYLTAHPMSWGVVFWAVGHLLSNGDKAHVVLFATFLLYSVVSMYSGSQRGQKPALDKRPPIVAELVLIAIVAAVYTVLFWGHRYFTGMPLI